MKMDGTSWIPFSGVSQSLHCESTKVNKSADGDRPADSAILTHRGHSAHKPAKRATTWSGGPKIWVVPESGTIPQGVSVPAPSISAEQVITRELVLPARKPFTPKPQWWTPIDVNVVCKGGIPVLSAPGMPPLLKQMEYLGTPAASMKSFCVNSSLARPWGAGGIPKPTMPRKSLPTLNSCRSRTKYKPSCMYALMLVAAKVA
mmetsp:Transcript_31305/g.57357  ORF Transcript_31305/g.57357 Transcript_31305/m.57357 type:complete len:203 (-) Transcript_31305:638-1246(-)